MTDTLDQIPSQSGPRDQDLIQLVNTLFTQARSSKRRYLERWERYDRMLRNRTWSDARDRSLPSPSSSEFFPTVSTLVAWMTDQSPTWFVGPHPDLRDLDHPPDPELVAQKARDMQIVLQSWWLTSRANAPLERALWDMWTFGAGILRTGYDPSLDNGRGQVTLTRCDPWSILPDPDASDLDDCKYFIECRQVSLVEIMQRYPERGHLVEPQDTRQTSDQRPRAQGGMELIAQPGMAATGVTGEFPGTATPGIPPLWPADRARGIRPSDYTGTALLIECWVKEVASQTFPYIEQGRITEITVEMPNWRHVAMAGNVVLTTDTENPFDHGQLPYVRMPLVEMGEFWSIPLAEHILPAQIALNRLLAAIQVNLELVGNPIWLEPTASGTARTKLTNQPGARVPFNIGAKPEWATPPSMPAQVPQTIDFWRNTIDRISGISAVARGANLRRRESAQAVDAVQEASFVRVRAALRNMELALQSVGDLTASNVVQFYAEPRAVPQVGEYGSDKMLLLSPNHFTYPTVEKGKIEEVPLRFSAWIEAGSSQPISRAARIAEVESLRFQGALSLDSLLKAHRVPDREREIEKIKAEQAEMGGPDAGQRQNTRRER